MGLGDHAHRMVGWRTEYFAYLVDGNAGALPVPCLIPAMCTGAGELIIFCLGALVGRALVFSFNTYSRPGLYGRRWLLWRWVLHWALSPPVYPVRTRNIKCCLIMGRHTLLSKRLSCDLSRSRHSKLDRAPGVLHGGSIHHHFELKGWPESALVIRCAFWIFTVNPVLSALATLKLSVRKLCVHGLPRTNSGSIVGLGRPGWSARPSFGTGPWSALWPCADTARIPGAGSKP